MTPNFPLLELFTRLREPLKLGIDQYTLLLEALDKGFGHGGVEDLKSLCGLLWLKSRLTEAEKKFNQIFEEYVQQYQAPCETERESPEILSPPNKQSNSSPIDSSAKSIDLPPKTSSTFARADFRLPAAYEGSPPIDLTRSEKGYILKTSDFPFLDRPLRQKWRQVRQRVRHDFTEEADIPATLALIARDRICWNPPRQPRWENQFQLLFLEDIEGSMVPFRPIVQELFNTVESRQFQRVDRYYFRNSIGDFVYEKPKGASIIPLTELPLRSNASIVIIISDAGAARRGNNRPRWQQTETFLQFLQPRVKSLIWLNPIPSERWPGTTAAEIDRLIDGRMFAFPQTELNLALSIAKRGSRG